MEDIITFTELCKELNIYVEKLNSKVKRAHNLFKKGYIEYDIMTLVIKDKIYIEQHNRIQITKFIMKKDKEQFLNAISLVKSHKGTNTGEQVVNAWSADSIYCYKIKGSCKNCKIARGYSILYKECQMKKKIIELVRKVGIPKKI